MLAAFSLGCCQAIAFFPLPLMTLLSLHSQQAIEFFNRPVFGTEHAGSHASLEGGNTLSCC
jgi:hypothetical protein